LKGGVDSSGKLTAWQNHFVSLGKEKSFAPSAGIGPNEFPAGFVPAFSFGSSLMPSGIPTYALRAPGSNGYAWVFQCFLDELAHAAGMDPVQFRLQLLSAPRVANASTTLSWQARSSSIPFVMRGVLELVARESQWGNALYPEARAWAFAFHFSHRGHFAGVALLHVDSAKKVKAEKIWIAGDIGGQIIIRSTPKIRHKAR